MNELKYHWCIERTFAEDLTKVSYLDIRLKY